MLQNDSFGGRGIGFGGSDFMVWSYVQIIVENRDFEGFWRQMERFWRHFEGFGGILRVLESGRSAGRRQANTSFESLSQHNSGRQLVIFHP